MKAEFDIRLSARDLFEFNMYQTYTSIHGFVSILLAGIIWVMAGITANSGEVGYTLLYIAIGFLFLLYMPVTLWSRAKRTIKTNEVLSGVLHFEVTEQAIRVTQGAESGELPWNMIYQIVANRKHILIYSNRVNAYIIPREQISEQYEVFSRLAKEKLEPFRLKMK